MSLPRRVRSGLTNVRVHESDPPGIFDDAAMRTVRSCDFRPATFQGKAVPVSGIEWTIDFDLER